MAKQTGRKKVCILKSSQGDDIWGLAVDPLRKRSFFTTTYLGIDSEHSERELLEKMRSLGFKSLNSFILHAVEQGLVRLVEPCGEDGADGAFLFPRKPDFLWSIDNEKLVPTGAFRRASYFVCRSRGRDRYIRALPRNARCCTYDPAKRNMDGDLVWYDLDGKRNVVFKRFDGTTYANIIDNADLRKLLGSED